MASLSQGASASFSVPTELVVVLNPYDHGFSEFIGSRVMLEAEGIIPEGFKWPEGYDDVHWQAGGFDYQLRRQRPEGAKGSRRDFANIDWWCLRWELTNAPSYAKRDIMRKARALKDAIYSQSAEGQAEWKKNWDRYWETTRDEKFQAFKGLIPGLVSRTRGRRPRNADQSQGAST